MNASSSEYFQCNQRDRNVMNQPLAAHNALNRTEIPFMPFTSPIENAQTHADTSYAAAASNVFSGLMPASKPVEVFAAIDQREPEDGDDMPEIENVLAHGVSSAGWREKFNTQYRKVIGPRLIQARINAGLPQSEAAKLLGYATPSQLCQWEQGTRLPPTESLIRAARLYCVSNDFLLGETDDALRDRAEGLRSSMLRGVRAQITHFTEIVCDQVERHTSLVGGNISTVEELLTVGQKLLDAVSTFQRRNHPSFDDMSGGAPLVAAVHAFEAELLSVQQKLRLSQALEADIRRAYSSLHSAGPDAADPLRPQRGNA